jgi:hypothetical protein
MFTPVVHTYAGRALPVGRQWPRFGTEQIKMRRLLHTAYRYILDDAHFSARDLVV